MGRKGGNNSRFTLQLEVQIDDEWHTIAELGSSGSQDTGKMRRIAENSTVPARLVEVHE